MAKGFGFVNRAAAESAARSGGSSLWGGKLIFKLADGDQAIARFIPCGEDDDGDVFVESAWHHEVPVEGRSWGDLIPCIAQDEDGNKTDDECPGCDADLPMKFKGYALLIWREGPVYKKDDKGKVVKDSLGAPVVLDNEDQVAIWSSGPRLFENLAETDENYGGLGSRDFRIKRKGESTETKYVIIPAEIDGGKKAMSAKDKKLADPEKHEIDLAEFIRPPSAEQFQARLDGTPPPSSSNGSGGGDEPSKAAAGTNPFKREKG